MRNRRRISRSLAGLLLALTSLTACSRHHERQVPSATLRTEPAPTSTTNPYAVPAVIDAAYLNRVLAALDAAIGDVVRIVVRSRDIPPEAVARLKALYAGKALDQQLDGFRRDAENHFAEYRQEPGNEKTTVSEVLTSGPECIFARVARDYSQVGVDPDPGLRTQYVALKPLSVASDPAHVNPTPWQLIYDGFQADRSQPPNPC